VKILVSNISKDRISLSVLVCDRELTSHSHLVVALRASPLVSNAEIATSIEHANDLLSAGKYNTIFIDPLAFGVDEASDFIFGIRRTRPAVVFVLFLDRVVAESQRESFYHGDRRRFSHYFSLDKRTPISAFTEEVESVLENCRAYLLANTPIVQLEELRAEASSLASSEHGADNSAIQGLTVKIDELLKRLPTATTRRNVRRNTVFLSCRFADEHYIAGLRGLLTESGFEVITGDSARGFISEAILERIRESEFFICLMTRDKETTDGTFTTSPWLLEEKGAAIAFGKYLVLLVEEGVTDYGGLQGDWQRHHFSTKGFTTAALKAVKQLRSAAGDSSQQDLI
jgi:hypothetical protein